MIALVIVLSTAMGITGAALACVLAGVGKLLCTSVIARRHWSSPLRALWPAHELLGLLFAFGISFFVARAFDGEVPPGPLPALVAGTLVYGVVIAIACRSNPRDRERVARVRENLHVRLRREVTA
jgi:hypothetical protein